MMSSLIQVFRSDANIRNTTLAFFAIGASVGALLSLRSPNFLPAFSGIGAAASSAIVAGTPGSKSRKQRQIEAEIKEKHLSLTSWQDNLVTIQQEIQDWHFKKNDLEEELKRQAFESVVTQVQEDYTPKYERLKQREEALNQATAKLREWEEQIKLHSQSVLAEAQEKINEAWEQAQNWSAEREKFYRSWAGQAISDREKLLRPQYPTGDTREELMAKDVIDHLAAIGVFAQRPLVIPTDAGFELSFDLLPFLLPQGFSRSIKENSGKPLTIDLAAKIIRENKKGLDACAPCHLSQCKPEYPERLRLIFKYAARSAASSELAPSTQTHPDTLLEFVTLSHQVGIIGEPGTGKTTLIKNILGLMNQSLGGSSQIIVINPKPSEGSQLPAKYKGFKRAIFGLLEAATEIAYRLSINEQVTDGNYPKHQPLIYFFDEFTETARRWNSISKERFARVIETFERSLSPERLAVFENDILEFVEPTKFAPSLLQFCWNVGRSEKVKTLIAGQKLMAGTLGCNVQDLNCLGWVSLGDSIEWAKDNLIYSFQKPEISKQQQHLIEQQKKFYGLFVPSGKKAYLADLPPENAYPCPTNSFQIETPKIITESELDESWNDETEENTPTNDSQKLATLKKNDNHGLSTETPQTETPSESPECDPLSSDPSTSIEPKHGKGLERWSRLADPQKLVISAENQIFELIANGNTDAYSICKSIWGDAIKPNTKPYAGKNGVKQLIEQLLKINSSIS